MKVRTSNWLFGIMMIVIVGISFIATSCTDNQRARGWGGTMTINLEPNEKLVNVTWKETDMWLLTRPMVAGEQPQVYKFKEKSTFGVMQGEITIVESRELKPVSELYKKWTDIGEPPEWFIKEQKSNKLLIANNLASPVDIVYKDTPTMVIPTK
jgi:hypothetical protein